MHSWENWIWNWIERCPLACLIWNRISFVSPKLNLCSSFTVVQLHARVHGIRPPYINSILIYVCTISCSYLMQFSPFSHTIIPYLYIFTSIFIVSANSLGLMLFVCNWCWINIENSLVRFSGNQLRVTSLQVQVTILYNEFEIYTSQNYCHIILGPMSKEGESLTGLHCQHFIEENH